MPRILMTLAVVSAKCNRLTDELVKKLYMFYNNQVMHDFLYLLALSMRLFFM